MRLPLGGHGPPYPGQTEIVARLYRPLGQPRSAAGAFWQAGRVCRQVGDPPVPEAAAGRRVGVVNADREALSAFRRAGPRERRRDILAGAVPAVENLLVGDLSAGLDVWAGQRQRVRRARAQESRCRQQAQNRIIRHALPPKEPPFAALGAGRPRNIRPRTPTAQGPRRRLVLACCPLRSGYAIRVVTTMWGQQKRLAHVRIHCQVWESSGLDEEVQVMIRRARRGQRA